MTFGERARLEARRRYRATGFRRTFVRGALARAAGRPIEACPYPRQPRSEESWRRTWRSAWLTGYAWAAEIQQR